MILSPLIYFNQVVSGCELASCETFFLFAKFLQQEIEFEKECFTIDTKERKKV